MLAAKAMYSYKRLHAIWKTLKADTEARGRLECRKIINTCITYRDIYELNEIDMDVYQQHGPDMKRWDETTSMSLNQQKILYARS